VTRVACLACVAVLAAAMTACGSGEQDSTADKQVAQAVVLQMSDLPEGSIKAEEALVSEDCDPIEYFKSYASAIAAPFGFVLPHIELLQTVGTFETSEEARKAFDEVSSKAARDCVGVQMLKGIHQQTGSKGALRAKSIPKSIPGETTRTMRLVARAPLASVEVQRTAILHERLLTTLTFISLNRPLNPALWESISRQAAARVDRAASSLAN